jgi:hypothetical protein
MKLNLKATIIATAVVMTLDSIQRILKYVPYAQERMNNWSSDQFAVYGLVIGVLALFLYICALLIGFAISSNRENLPALSPCMRTQLIVIVGMIIFNLLWYVVYYSIGSENIPEVCRQIVSYWLITQKVLLTAWLWQLAFTKQGTFSSANIGKTGKIFSWGWIISIVAMFATAIVFIIVNESDLPRFFYSISAEIGYIMNLILLGGYWWFERKNNNIV